MARKRKGGGKGKAKGSPSQSGGSSAAGSPNRRSENAEETAEAPGARRTFGKIDTENTVDDGDDGERGGGGGGGGGGSGEGGGGVALQESDPGHDFPAALKDNRDILNDEEIRLAQILLSAGQEHLFKDWTQLGSIDDDRKHNFFSQVKRLDETYPAPGGLATYLSRARTLLAEAKAGLNPLDGWTPSVPAGERLDPGTEAYAGLEALGAPELGHVGFVLVAGGLGERLGYSGIKLELPTDLATETTYLGLYIHQILALQRRCGAEKSLPLAIMVSEDTHKGTLRLLEQHDHFGMAPENITLMKQEKVAAIEDSDGRMALDPNDPYRILTKPHGHGDVHSLLHRTGVAAKWLAAGHKWIVFMQDTNGLALHTLAAALGVSKKLGLEVNSMAIPRKAKQAIGGITKLTHADGRTMTINVEYNQLHPLLMATGSGEGDVNDPCTGYSKFPGNINQLLFALEPYVEVLERTGGVLGEFVNPKYKDETRTAFKSPTRLECMMQDYPKAVGPSARVGFTSVEPWACFSPVKNNLADAAKAQAGGTPAASAATGEADQYNLWAELMRRRGCQVEAAPPHAWGAEASRGGNGDGGGGVTAAIGPHIVLDPTAAVSCGDVAAVFATPSAVRITARSTLLVRGACVKIEKLDLDGALVIEAEEGASVVVRNLTVRNEGWQLHELSEREMNSPQTLEVLRMRGYRLLKLREQSVVVTAAEKSRVVDDTVPRREGGGGERNCFMGILALFGLFGGGNKEQGR